MDTDWYAMDRAGHVARFSSGEEGAVPWAACREYWDTLYGEIVVARIAAACKGGPLDEAHVLGAARDAATDPVERQLVTQILGGDDHAREVYADWLEAHGKSRDGWSPRERSVYTVGKEIRRIDPAQLPATWSGVLAFATADDREMFRTQHEHAVAAWREVDARLGIAHGASVEELHQYAFDDFWSAGAIAAAFLVEHAVDPHDAGLYEYACSFRGPYYQRAIPRTPLTIADLPEPLRARIAALELVRHSFDTTAELEPERYFDCQLYGT